MQGLILAAGMGKRLKGLTRNNTKCMVKVNGVRLIDRVLSQFATLKLSRIVLVIGYEGEKLKNFVGSEWKGTPIKYIENPIYDKTNNIYSLALAGDALCEDDTLLIESDLILQDGIFQKVLDDPHPNIALVDKFQSWMDGTCVIIDEDNRINRFVPKKDFAYDEISAYYKTVNVYKFSKEFSREDYVPFLKAYSKALGDNEYYEQVLRVVTLLDKPLMYALPLNGEKWYEIDDFQDLDIAESMFCPTSEQVKRLSARYGGYWRYPNLKDFCYLVTPYFPPERLKAEIKNNFNVLLGSYPSGQRVNALLAAKTFSLRIEQIAVGNGAAELIQAYMECKRGKFGFIYPTFEEYPNRIEESRRVVFQSETKGFRYCVNDIIDYFSSHPVETLVVINPDNPSGNFLPCLEMMQLIEWAGKQGIELLVDESFVDFADQPYTLLNQDLLDKNPHLLVMKSISKSYGVPGLRLGVLASGNCSLINGIKKDLPIWNINSFGEFFLQIIEKYKDEYKVGCQLLAKERQRFTDELQKIPFFEVFPSNANYILVKVNFPYTSEQLTITLWERANILLKDCSHKKGFLNSSYIRIAVRDKEDNDQFLESLKLFLYR